MMGHREKVKRADEFDLIGWKRLLGRFIDRTSHSLKRRMSRRARLAARRAIARESTS